MPCITANIVSTASGISAWLMPMTTPVRLKTSGNGASMRPCAFSALLMMPFLPNSTIQASVRTKTLVQNGSSTARITKLCERRLTVASK